MAGDKPASGAFAIGEAEPGRKRARLPLNIDREGIGARTDRSLKTLHLHEELAERNLGRWICSKGSLEVLVDTFMGGNEHLRHSSPKNCVGCIQGSCLLNVAFVECLDPSLYRAADLCFAVAHSR